MNATEALTSADSSQLLEAFIHKFNDVIEESDLQAGEINQLADQLAGYKRQCQAQTEEIRLLKEENSACRNLALEAEAIANKSLGLQRERDKLKDQVNQLQQQYTQLKGGDNPKRLREQIKRLKEANSKHQSRAKTLTSDGAKYRAELSQREKAINERDREIDQLKKQLSHDTGSGLYHDNQHHLIIWPQKTKMQRPDGGIFEGRSLLYLHESGRGGLITFDPENGAALCAAPRGGLRPSNDCVDFAQNWLYKVNELQDGIVKEVDMVPVNYNGKMS